MPIDSSIYFQQQGPDFAGSIQRGLSMRDMVDERALKQKALAENEAVKAAYQKGVVQNQDGSTTFDGKLTGAELMKVNPEKGLAFQQQQTAQEQAQQKLKEEQRKEQIDFLGRTAGQVNAQNYGMFLQDAKQRGLPTEIMPPQWGPEAQQKLNYYQGMALTAKEQMDNQFKEREFGLKKEELGIKRSEANTNRTQKATAVVSELRKERSSLPTTKATQDMAVAYNKIQSAAANPSAAGDLSLIFGYMKMLDPGSTVREGEFANAQNAAGLPAKVVNAYNNALNGQRLNTDQRNDFIGQAGGIYKSQMDVQNKVDAKYAELAKRSGADPSDVLLNFEANQAKPVSKSPVKSADALSHPKVDQAAQWAKANPNDPRAKEILQRLGK